MWEALRGSRRGPACRRARHHPSHCSGDGGARVAGGEQLCGQGEHSSVWKACCGDGEKSCHPGMFGSSTAGASPESVHPRACPGPAAGTRSEGDGLQKVTSQPQPLSPWLPTVRPTLSGLDGLLPLSLQGRRHRWSHHKPQRAFVTNHSVHLLQTTACTCYRRAQPKRG